MCQTPDHGAEPDLSPSSTSVYAFNSDIVLSTQPASLTKVNNEGSIEACAASHNNYALILGHTNGQSSHFVDCYDTSLTKTSYSIPSLFSEASIPSCMKAFHWKNKIFLLPHILISSMSMNLFLTLHNLSHYI